MTLRFKPEHFIVKERYDRMDASGRDFLERIATQAARTANDVLDEWLREAPLIEFSNVEWATLDEVEGLPSGLFTARIIDIKEPPPRKDLI